jgi:hypothetical protein
MNSPPRGRGEGHLIIGISGEKIKTFYIRELSRGGFLK